MLRHGYKGKGNAVPLQAWSGPEGSRKLRFPDFMTMAQEGDKVVSPMHRPHLTPGNPHMAISSTEKLQSEIRISITDLCVFNSDITLTL